MRKLNLKLLLILLNLAWASAAPARPVSDARTSVEISGPVAWAPVRMELRTSAVLGSIGLLLGAGVCLCVLEVKIYRRTHGNQQRLAVALAAAMRSGAIEFGTGERGLTLSQLWIDDEPEEGCKELVHMPSRYALLGYNQTYTEEPLKVVTRQFGVNTAPADASADRDLLPGVPMYLLKPEVAREIAMMERSPVLQEG